MGLFKKLFKGSKKKEVPIERNLMSILPGDIIMYFGEDYEVTATVEWVEDGYSWKEYKLTNKGKAFWISAEIDDGEVSAGFYEVVEDIDFHENKKELKYRDMVFKFEEKGKAQGVLTSKLGKQNYKCKYYQYETEDGSQKISIEDYDGEMEMSIGEDLKQNEVNILPGS